MFRRIIECRMILFHPLLSFKMTPKWWNDGAPPLHFAMCFLSLQTHSTRERSQTLIGNLQFAICNVISTLLIRKRYHVLFFLSSSNDEDISYMFIYKVNSNALRAVIMTYKFAAPKLFKLLISWGN